MSAYKKRQQKKMCYPSCPPDSFPLTIVHWCIVRSRSPNDVVIVVIGVAVVIAAAVTLSSPAIPPDWWPSAVAIIVLLLRHCRLTLVCRWHHQLPHNY